MKKEFILATWKIQLLLFLTSLFTWLGATAQDSSPYNLDTVIFTIVEVMPEFPGGEVALKKYMNDCPYPDFALENHIEGVVFTRFVIEKNGKLSNFEIVKGADKRLNEATLEYLMKMPDWQPGRQRGNPERVYFHIPIKFSIDEYNKKNKQNNPSRKNKKDGN